MKVFIEDLVVVDMATRSGSVPLVMGVRSTFNASQPVYRAVVAVDGKPAPSLWAKGTYQALRSAGCVLAVTLYKGCRSAQLVCPQCRRQKPNLIVRSKGGTHQCWQCHDRRVQTSALAGPVIRYNGHRLELAEHSTLTQPTSIRLAELIVAWNRFFPLSPQDKNHPRWILAAQEFQTFVWEMTGLTPSDGWLWRTVVQPVWQPVMRAWEQEDWEGYQAAIAAGKDELASYQLSGMLSSGVMEMVEGTA